MERRHWDVSRLESFTTCHRYRALSRITNPRAASPQMTTSWPPVCGMTRGRTLPERTVERILFQGRHRNQPIESSPEGRGVPRVWQSGSRATKYGAITKRGRGHARAVLVEAAWAAVKTPGPLRAFYQRLRVRRGPQVAVVATVRKLLIWKDRSSRLWVACDDSWRTWPAQAATGERGES